jgi:hypothetical protein
MTVVWRSAIPPTLCTIFLCVLYIQFATAKQVCSRLYLVHSEPSSIFIFIILSFGTYRLANADDWLASYTQKKEQFWYSTIQGIVAKLYILSLFSIMYGIPLHPANATFSCLTQ